MFWSGVKFGVLPTLALVILTAIAGSILLRWQGLATLARIQTELAAGRVPGKELVNGVMILVAGMLLMTPGFVTDLLGLLLFVPPMRDLVWRFLSKRVTFQTFGGRGFGARANDAPAAPDIVDLDEDEYQRNPDRKSPWSIGDDSNQTRH